MLNTFEKKQNPTDYRMGLHYIAVTEEDSTRMMDIRDYASNVNCKFHGIANSSIKAALRINMVQSRFKCGVCNKASKVSKVRLGDKEQMFGFVQANPGFPVHDKPVCDDCYYTTMLGRLFTVDGGEL